MLSLRPINLPTPVLISSTAILGLGVYVSLFRRTPTPKTRNPNQSSPEIFVPNPTTRRIADTNALFGIVTSALMLPYFLSSYMPIEENQWLHVSVPVRLGISATMLGNCLLRGRRGMSEEGFWEFLTLAVFDGVGAVALGVQLGSFDGRVPGLI